MPFEQDIRRQAERLITGKLSFASFEDWFVDETWDIGRSGDSAAIELTYEIERLIAEVTSGHRSVESFRDSIARLLDRVRVSYGTSESEFSLSTGGSAAIQSVQLPTLVGAGKSRAGGSE